MLLHFFLSTQLLLNIALISNDPVIENTLNDNQIMIQSNTQNEDLKSMIERYAAYNHWADQQLAEWLSSDSDEDLSREIESSFSSIKETVIHIWNAEYLWLQIVKEESYENSPAKSFEGNKEELLAGWLKASENFSNHVKTMSIEDLQVKRPRSKGDGHTLIMDMIQHCMNHSTYHRGQIITMGRQAGLENPPRTDFIYYVQIDK